MSIFKYGLGDALKDAITGFTGVATARTEWLNGCIRYQLQPQKLVEGKQGEDAAFDECQLSFDECQLSLVKARAVDVGQAKRELPDAPKPPGGPRKDARSPVKDVGLRSAVKKRNAAVSRQFP